MHPNLLILTWGISIGRDLFTATFVPDGLGVVLWQKKDKAAVEVVQTTVVTAAAVVETAAAVAVVAAEAAVETVAAAVVDADAIPAAVIEITDKVVDPIEILNLPKLMIQN